MNPKMRSPYATHAEAEILLPWYINGSLREDETHLVNNHLRVCLTCRKELVGQQLLAKSLQRTPLIEVSSMPAFERLKSRIVAYENQTTERQKSEVLRSKKSPAIFGFSWFDSFLNSMSERSLTVAFASLLLIFILPFAAHEMQQTTVQQFHTVANAGSLDQFTKNDIHVIFVDQPTDQQIEALLKPLHVYIVEGPTASKVYTIRMNNPEQSEQLLAAAIQSLRANKLVALAEPALPWKVESNKDGG
jgi:hypothetical protein